ncbi:hypothetical protein CEXT_496871, partial [Caerostris extrusa]
KAMKQKDWVARSPDLNPCKASVKWAIRFAS